MDPPWCSCTGRGIKSRLFLLTVGLFYCQFCSWPPPYPYISQTETWTEKHCILRLLLVDVLSLSPLKGVRTAYWSTDHPLTHTYSCSFLPLLFTGILLINLLHIYFFLCIYSSQAQTGTSIYQAVNAAYIWAHVCDSLSESTLEAVFCLPSPNPVT